MSSPELAARRTSARAALVDYERARDAWLNLGCPRDDGMDWPLWCGRLGQELRNVLAAIAGSCAMCGHYGDPAEMAPALVCTDEGACADRLAAAAAAAWVCDACGAVSDRPGCMAPGCPGPIDSSRPLVPAGYMSSHRQDGTP